MNSIQSRAPELGFYFDGDPGDAMILDLLIREATENDIPEMLRHRRGMYEDMDYSDPDTLSAMVSTCEQYLAKAMTNGSFRSWLALSGNRVIGGGAVLISPWPSHPYDLECRRATILSGISSKRHCPADNADDDRLVPSRRFRGRLSACEQYWKTAVRRTRLRAHERDAIEAGRYIAGGLWL